MTMPFVNTITFAHRFSDDKTLGDCCSYQEINQTYSNDNAIAVTRAFYQFMMACGYAPQSVITAMSCLSDEYGAAYCYDRNKEE